MRKPLDAERHEIEREVRASRAELARLLAHKLCMKVGDTRWMAARLIEDARQIRETAAAQRRSSVPKPPPSGE